MLNLKNYLYTDKSKHRYKLPLSAIDCIKYSLLKSVLFRLPIKNIIYIKSKYNLNLYWSLLIFHLERIFKAEFSLFYIFYIDNKLSIYSKFKIKDSIIQAGGHDPVDIDISLSKAIGEFLERLATHNISLEDRKFVKNYTYKNLKDSVKLYDDYHFHTKEQKAKYKRYNSKNEDEFKCLPVEDLYSGDIKYYPAQCIFWNEDSVKEEPLLGTMVGSGSAGHFTIEEATLSAIYELVERDGFMCHWLTQISPRQIILKKGDLASYDNFVEKISGQLVSFYILDTITDIGIPSTICVCFIKDKGACISGGSGIDMISAINKSIHEMMQTLSLHMSKVDKEDAYTKISKDYQPFLESKMGAEERLGLYLTDKNNDRLEFLISGHKVNFSDICMNDLQSLYKKQELDNVMKLLKNLNSHENYNDQIYRYVYKNNYLYKLGYVIVKVIIPKLYPLYLREHQAFPESLRLNQFAVHNKIGLKDFQINTFPHPFP